MVVYLATADKPINYTIAYKQRLDQCGTLDSGRQIAFLPYPVGKRLDPGVWKRWGQSDKMPQMSKLGYQTRFFTRRILIRCLV